MINFLKWLFGWLFGWYPKKCVKCVKIDRNKRTKAYQDFVKCYELDEPDEHLLNCFIIEREFEESPFVGDEDFREARDFLIEQAIQTAKSRRN